MPYFPLFVDLKNKPVLVAGGGSVALRKLQKLEAFGARLTVAAPEILPDIEAIPGVKLRRRGFRPWDLYPRPALVIAASDSKETNRKIARLCERRHIPVNVVDDPEACGFLFPALVTKGSFCAGISTGGASPTAAAYVKELLQEQLPDRLDEILAWLEAQRPRVKAAVPEQSRRAAVFQALFDACAAKGAPLTPEETENCLSPAPLGSVALVGAGCGKADLITLRGLGLLRRCQAVVYDDLIDPALLDAAPESALRIYVGKRSGTHSMPQERINQKLLELARSGLRVVRLKGGDPYLFGRGGEEMMALKTAGIACQEVPGIPSAIGIPAEAGIPVTHRGISRGLHIVTAHTSDKPDGLPGQFDLLAKLEGTLVFLMGLGQLPGIIAGLLEAGKDGNTPAAVLSGGNAPHPARVRAPLSQLERAVREAKVSAPAVILVGEAAAMDLSPSARPLAGARIGVTGTEETARKQVSAFQALGAEAVWISRSVVRERPGKLPALEERQGWLVFTSANGVNTFFRQMEGQKIDRSSLKTWKFAVIGAATGEALARHGIHADLCPQKFTSEALAAELAASAKREEEILLLRSSGGSPVLPRILTEAGFSVRDIPLYDLEAAEDGTDPLPPLDYLTFSSAGGVELFFRQYGAVPEKVRCVCIGDVTARALSRHTDTGFLMAAEISAAGIVKAILDDYP